MNRKIFFLAIVFFFPIFVMAQSNNITVSFLQSFVDAFNAHDVISIMNHMTEDCVFDASAGPDSVGKRYVGQLQVKQAFEEVFATFPDAHWGNSRHYIFGDKGLSEWIFTGTKTDGSRVEVTGCDIFTFSNGKISIKNSYRKNRIPVK